MRVAATRARAKHCFGPVRPPLRGQAAVAAAQAAERANGKGTVADPRAQAGLVLVHVRGLRCNLQVAAELDAEVEDLAIRFRQNRGRAGIGQAVADCLLRAAHARADGRLRGTGCPGVENVVLQPLLPSLGRRRHHRRH
eukprot:5998972-Alexandrium_andersonii.AAC.1